MKKNLMLFYIILLLLNSCRRDESESGEKLIDNTTPKNLTIIDKAFIAIENNDYKELNIIIKENPVADLKNEYGFSVLKAAELKGNYELAKLLVENDADINQVDYRGKLH